MSIYLCGITCGAASTMFNLSRISSCFIWTDTVLKATVASCGATTTTFAHMSWPRRNPSTAWGSHTIHEDLVGDQSERRSRSWLSAGVGAAMACAARRLIGIACLPRVLVWLKTHILLATVVCLATSVCWLLGGACLQATSSGDADLAGVSASHAALRRQAVHTPNCLHAYEVGIARRAALVKIADASVFVDNFQVAKCATGMKSEVVQVRHRGHRCEAHPHQTDEFQSCILLMYIDLTGQPQTAKLWQNEAYCAQHMAIISEHGRIKNC